jgi:hypothetical protein
MDNDGDAGTYRAETPAVGVPGASKEPAPSGAEQGASPSPDAAQEKKAESPKAPGMPDTDRRAGSPQDKDRSAASPKGSADREAGKGKDEGTATTGAGSGESGRDAGQTKAGKISLDPEQRTKVQKAFSGHRSAGVISNPTFSIGIGVAVPRQVALLAIPGEIVVIVPEYRRYKYFVVDDRICIVDPDTYEIVDIIVLV